MKPWLLGLTGGIGSGKSAAAHHFKALGVPLIDADDAARWVVEPGRPALAAIAERFGQQVLNSDGSLNRAALREQIFQDQSQRQWLEALLHPLIRQEIHQYLEQAQSHYAILVSPLLIESGQYQAMQRVLVIDVPPDVQIARTQARDQVAQAQVEAIMQAQLSREARLKHAHDILLNDRDPAWLGQEVERLHQFYLTLKGGQP